MGHLADVCMGYCAHLRLSLFLSWTFLKASACAFVHAFAPNLFVTASTRYVLLAEQRIRASGCRGTELA